MNVLIKVFLIALTMMLSLHTQAATTYTQSVQNGVITFTPVQVAVSPIVVSPMPNMPIVDMTKIPLGSAGKNYVDLIPQQYPPTNDIGNITNGDFRIRCDYSHMLQDDPIVKPNQAGMAHLHTFFGNKGSNASSTTASLIAGGNSTCDGGIMNRSSYWIPSVIDTQTGTPIAPAGANFYYKTQDAANIKPPPFGLRMIAGNASAFSTQPDNKETWYCGDTNDTKVSGTLGYIPSCAVGNHLMAIIRFPNFWDGVNLDSADHKSHMSYIHDAAHPVMIPDITFNIRYDIRPGDDTTKWRLSSDMYDTSIAGGFSLHGDYMFGWSTDVKTGLNFTEIFTTNCLAAHVNCGNSLLGDGRQYYY